MQITSYDFETPDCPLLALALILMVWGYQLLEESPARRLLELAPMKVALAAAMIIYLVLIPSSGDAPFISFSSEPKSRSARVSRVSEGRRGFQPLFLGRRTSLEGSSTLRIRTQKSNYCRDAGQVLSPPDF